MNWCSGVFRRTSMILVLVLSTVILRGRPVSASFSIEYVDEHKSEEDNDEDAVILYECGSPRSQTPVQSPATSSPNRRKPDKVGKAGTGSWPVACKRVDSRNKMQDILSTNNFFVVRNPTLAKGELLYDQEAMAPLKLPSIVNVGVEFDIPTFPRLEQPSNLLDTRRTLAKLKALKILPYFYNCPEHLVNFLSISDISYVTRDSPAVVRELAAFVATLNRITKIYYKDYYRTFWMWFNMEINMSPWRIRQTGVELYYALKIVLPKMIDPCLIMSYQTIAYKNAIADDYCSSYCRVLVVAADLFEQKGKTCTVRWGEGKCRNNKCICIKSIAGLKLFASNTPMYRCNNEVVQSNIRSIFYSLEKRWPWTDGLMRWIFFPRNEDRMKEECSKIPRELAKDAT